MRFDLCCSEKEREREQRWSNKEGSGVNKTEGESEK